MAVRIAAGHHLVRFIYTPPWWKKALFWVAVGVIAVALVALAREAMQSLRR